MVSFFCTAGGQHALFLHEVGPAYPLCTKQVQHALSLFLSAQNAGQHVLFAQARMNVFCCTSPPWPKTEGGRGIFLPGELVFNFLLGVESPRTPASHIIRALE